MQQLFGGDIAKEALDNCRHLISKELEGKIIRPTYIRKVVSWIEALQKEIGAPVNLDNTFYKESSE